MNKTRCNSFASFVVECNNESCVEKCKLFEENLPTTPMVTDHYFHNFCAKGNHKIKTFWNISILCHWLTIKTIFYHLNCNFLVTSLAHDFACLNAIHPGGASCVYPYNYKKLIDWVGCTLKDGGGRKWCYTDIESKAYVFCPSECGIAYMINMWFIELTLFFFQDISNNMV